MRLSLPPFGRYSSQSLTCERSCSLTSRCFFRMTSVLRSPPRHLGCDLEAEPEVW